MPYLHGRREFITLLTGAVVRPSFVRAQSWWGPTVRALNASPPKSYERNVARSQSESRKPIRRRPKTIRSNTAGRRAGMIGSREWAAILFVVTT